jgi:hypothetical protein
MFGSTLRKNRTLASAALGLVALGSVALGASPAHATTTVGPSTGLGPGTSTVSVSVSAIPTGAAFYAVAVCNIDAGVTPGTRCDAGNASSFTPVSVTTIGLSVSDSFADYDYTAGAGPVATGTTTDCKTTAGSSQCAVVTNYYSASFVPVGTDVVPISF